VPAAAGRLARGESPYALPPDERPQAREAWSTSFRLEPPRLLTPGRAPVPPGPAILGLLPGTRDPRVISLLALGLLIWVAGRLAPPERRPLALGVAGLSTPLAMGIVVGSGHVLPLACLAGAFLAWERRRPLVVGILIGLACGMDHRVFLIVPILAMATRRTGRTPLLAGCAAAYAILALPVAALSPTAFVAALGPGAGFEAGVGLANGLLYLGHSGTRVSTLLLSALAVVFAAILARWAAGRPSLAMALSAGGLLAALFLSRGGSPEGLALPLVVLTLAAVVTPGLVTPGGSVAAESPPGGAREQDHPGI
jgi:hypothetical protein